MTTKSGPKKEHWIKAAKAKADTLDALLKAHGVDNVDDLNAKLAGIIDHSAETVGSPVAVMDVDLTVPASEDPLAWITHETPYVSIVSSKTIFTLRGRQKDAVPPISGIKLKAQRSARWSACPFYIGDRNDHIMDNNIKQLKANWWHHRLTATVAKNVHADERIEKPAKAILSPENFTKWDHYGNCPSGTFEPIIDFVPLREVTRFILQKFSDTFLDWLARPAGHEFDRAVPNPYRNRISDVTVEFINPRPLP